MKVSTRASFIRQPRTRQRQGVDPRRRSGLSRRSRRVQDRPRALDAATPTSVLAAAKKWIAKGDYTLTVTPAPEGADDDAKDEAETAGRAATEGRPAPIAAAGEGVHGRRNRRSRAARACRRSMRSPISRFPKLERGKLKNGIEVDPRPASRDSGDAGAAAVRCGLRIGSGPRARHVGVHDGDARRRHQRRSIRSRSRGAKSGSARRSARARDSTRRASASARCPRRSRRRSRCYADIVRNPAFRDDDIARVRGQWLARIAQEKTQPRGTRAAHAAAAALRRRPRVRDSVHRLRQRSGDQRADRRRTCARTSRDRLRPDNAKILVAGDTTLDAIIPELDAVFGDWKAPATRASEEEHRAPSKRRRSRASI